MQMLIDGERNDRGLPSDREVMEMRDEMPVDLIGGPSSNLDPQS